MKRLLLAAPFFAASPALAHHPLGGLPMETFSHGVLSGIGHPVLGFDHLFFVLAMGVMAHLSGQRFGAPLAYISAMLLGCVGTYAGLVLPLREGMIALSLIVLGGLVVRNRTGGRGVVLLAFAGFGLFHGAAFGASIATQEGGAGAAVLIGYLIGLGAVQYLIAIGAGLAARHASTLQTQLAGAMVAGVGIFLFLEQVEPPLLAFLISG